ATAAKVFAAYGEDETFQRVLDRHGHSVIPVIAFFIEHGSLEFQIRQAVGDALAQMWEGKTLKWSLADITREQIGLIAIRQLAERGNEMLAEFEIVDGTAKLKPMTRLVLSLKDQVTMLVREERLPSWKEIGFAAKEIGFAALDVTIVG